MSLLDRYILREMIGPALAGLLAFVVLITGHVLFTVVDVVAGKGVRMERILEFAACKAPEAAVLALPVATLLGCALALNRLASDNELVPLLASGVSGFRLMLPAAYLGLAATVLSVTLKEFAVPWAGQEAERFYRELLLRQKTLAFKPGKFVDTGGRWMFIARGVDRDHETLQGLRVLMKRPGEFPLIMHAPVAHFRGDTLKAADVVYYDFALPQRLTCGTGDLTLNLGGLPPGSISAETTETQSLRQLLARRAQVAAGGPEARREYDLEIHSRLSLAVACLVLSLLALPIALRFGRGQSLAGVLATLIVAFVYFVVMLGLKLLGGNGTLPAVVAAWVQDIVLAAAALLAVRRL